MGMALYYVPVNLVRRYLGAMYRPHEVRTSIMFYVSIVATVINVSVLVQIFHRLHNLIALLKERGQSEKLQLFDQFKKILIAFVVVVTACACYEFYLYTADRTNEWETEWIMDDAVPHFVFFGFAAIMLYLWAPHKNALRYAFSASAVGNDGASKVAGVSVDDSNKDEEDG